MQVDEMSFSPVVRRANGEAYDVSLTLLLKTSETFSVGS